MCSWRCGGCGVWYPYSVSRCECNKLLHIETTGGTQPASLQQLQAKIRLSLERIKGAALDNDMSSVFRLINETYAELSAMQ